MKSNRHVWLAVALIAVALSVVGLVVLRGPTETGIAPTAAPESQESAGTGDERVLVVGSWGGAYQEAQRRAFFEPFTAETGIQIVETSTPDYGKFYEWQEAGSASIDVVDVETYFVYQAAEKGALYQIPPETHSSANLAASAVTDYGVASCAYADVIAWNSSRHPEWANLTWNNFWDITGYPGARGLRDLPASTLEAALLASGAPPGQLYPLDLDRAFDSLSLLRKRGRIALWSKGSQPIEWLLTGAVDITTAWNGRVHDAQEEGKPISMTFEGGMLDWLWWVVPRDAKNPELALQFIAFTLRPDRQAELTRHIPYGPSNLDAMDLVDEETAHHLPTSDSNLPLLIQRDNSWWAENDEVTQPRWRAWKLRLDS